MPVLANAKHEAVALAYLADPQKVGWRAYSRVYPKCSKHAAENSFARLMKNDEFAARVAETHDWAAQGAVMGATEVLEELSKLGRANMQDYLRATKDGDPYIDLSKLGRDQAAALAQVTVEDFTEGRGKDAREVRRVTIRLADKRGALDLLGKHYVLFTKKHIHEHVGIADRLAAALARVEGKGHGRVRPHSDAPRSQHASEAGRKGERARSR
jgi:phage terminase small subunit